MPRHLMAVQCCFNPLWHIQKATQDCAYSTSGEDACLLSETWLMCLTAQVTRAMLGLVGKA